MRRAKFKKGRQRAFLQRVIEQSGAPSLRALNQFGFDIPYSTLKNYFNESRNLPEGLFVDLCYLSKVKVSKEDFMYVEEHFGQVIGGRKSRKREKRSSK